MSQGIGLRFIRRKDDEKDHSLLYRNQAYDVMKREDYRNRTITHELAHSAPAEVRAHLEESNSDGRRRDIGPLIAG